MNRFWKWMDKQAVNGTGLDMLVVALSWLALMALCVVLIVLVS